jgi:prepilin signal peptidase PulO-like enzyme (type II secretory pathway)
MNGHIGISLFHIFFVVPLFLYVAFARGQVYPWVHQGLFGLGLVILIYHAYKTLIKWKAASLSVWINILHVLAVAPLMIYIGSKGYDTPRWAYEVLAMLGFAALGYHIYSIIMETSQMGNKGGERIVSH